MLPISFPRNAVARVKQPTIHAWFKEKQKHINILAEALQAPLLQIWENAGEEYDNGVFKDTDVFSGGYDVKNDKFGCMYEMGIIDPLKVTKCALQNAVSVAVTLLSTNAIVTMARTYEDKN